MPNGISNYEELIEDGYLYVDKTPYIEKLENLTDKFEKLYSETYIGKNPTKLKNSYNNVCRKILKNNFRFRNKSKVIFFKN